MSNTPTSALDVEALRPWFDAHVPESDGTPLSAELISGGRSNLTFGVKQGDREWVLRRPPLGHVLATAHDMGREYTVLAALRDTDVPVPRVAALCSDTDVIGAPFYVMQRVDGTILRTAEDTAGLAPADARAISESLMDALARIHAVDWKAVGLGSFGRPEGFLERQVRRWLQQWEKSKTRELPGLDALGKWLSASVPTGPAPTLVHGDYRLDNVILAPGTLAVDAVLDWEMSTLGDPLADLGLLIVYWADADDATAPPSVAGQIAGNKAFLSKAQIVEEYARRSGRDVSELPFYVVLGYFKIAIILEGIHRRYTMGATVGEGFDRIGAEVPKLVNAGLAAAGLSI